MIARFLPFEFTFLDYPDKDSEALILRMSGCLHGCKNCQNESIKGFDVGTEFTLEEIAFAVRETMEQNYTDKLVITGGDPLAPKNLPMTKALLKMLDCYICVYTGYSIEYVKKQGIEGFTFIKCGLYEENKACKLEKTDKLMSLASTNQNFYNEDFEQISENGKLYY